MAQEIVKARKEYTGIDGRILKLLIAGVRPVEVAAACGVTESRISQLKAEEDFLEQLAEGFRKNIEQAQLIDQNYGDIEEVMSKKLKELVPYCTSIDQVLRVAKVVNGMSKKVVGAGVKTEDTNGVAPVQLAIPIVAKNVFIMNPNSEVVRVDGQDLVTLNSASLKSLLDKREQKEIELNPKPREDTKIIDGRRKASQDKYADL